MASNGSADEVVLSNGSITACLDPGRGADILELTHAASGIDVFFSTPWRERADSIRAGAVAPVGTDSTSIWMEQYRGGWQIICPNPGAPRVIGGAEVGFHGETSTAPWRVTSRSSANVALESELFTIPLRVRRSVALDGARITVSDELQNLSNQRLEFDYCSHPAFGGPILEGDVRLTTGAGRFHPDPETFGAAGPSGTPWPTGDFGDRDPVDLSVLGRDATNPLVFGWLSDFADRWVQLSNHDLGIAARVTWDAAELPFTWLWEELNSTPTFPWFGRARTIAIEPSSTPTSGPQRTPGIVLDAQQAISLSTSIEILDESGTR
ncbi:hypothetical protein BHD05_12710 [Marisediminicola antarctica]|uniref:Aldose epimerase n=2 Tax=Marisediminicola antarctica TaxID=674079 RepID=A0A7L5AKR3_9MICO|nr:hypothetical protein BHD05_12710 [Marisediminicola antarctica]